MITDEMVEAACVAKIGERYWKEFTKVAKDIEKVYMIRALEAAEAVRPKMVHVADWVHGPSRSVMLHAGTDAEECIAQCCAESGDDQDDYTVTPLYAEDFDTKPSDPNNPVDSFGATTA